MRYAALLLLASACGPELDEEALQGAPGSESSESGDPEGGSDTGEGSTGEIEPEAPLDPSRQAPADLAGEACTALGEARYCGYQGRSRVETGVQACADAQIYDGPPRAWSECAATLACTPGDTMECGFGTASCVVLESGELGFEDCGFTPLAIDVGDRGFAFEPAGGRAFDIAANGACLDVDWPTGDTAWLALDRDGDGAIADGSELFGSGTPMPGSRPAVDGFAALATLDDDGDQVITPRDRAFAGLVLWTDLDGDRRGTAGELLGLDQVGIASVPLAFDRRHECDARGNCIVERATVSTTAGPRALVDLHLACQ